MKLRDADGFWAMVDEALERKGSSLSKMSVDIGLSKNSLHTSKWCNVLPPRLDTLIAMADYLDMSFLKLVFADEEAGLSPEALAVEGDQELRTVVRAMMKDRRLIPLAAAFVKAGETLSAEAQ